VKEAVADAKRVTDLAVEAAKQKLVEEMTPSLKNLVEKQLRTSINSEDIDRLNRARDGRGETEFEEGIKLEGEKSMGKDKDDDKELEKESLDSMFPGIREMGDDEEEAPMGMEMGMPPEGEEMPEMGMGYEMAFAGEEGEEPAPGMEAMGMGYEGEDPFADAPEGEEGEEEEMEEYGIPTLGEGDDMKDDKEGEMDEEITIDEKALQKAYENVMKSAAALEEASVTSGFADTYPGSEWETEESPPSDRGLEDKERDNAPWEKEKPKAAQDHTVKEAIEKGLKENRELARYVGYLEEQHANAVGVIRQLKGQIKEVNLFNRKVLKVNEMLNKFGKSLTSEQKKLVIAKIDEATDTKQVDLVSEALRAAFSSAKGLNEGKRRRPNRANAGRRLTSGGADQRVLRESVDKGARNEYARMRELAGLIGSKR
jgi:hypothetical protein